MDAVTLGEALIGLDSNGRRLGSARALEKSVGGAESNTAIGLARLGHRTRFIGRVGDDPLGGEIEQTLRGEGVDVTHLTRDAGLPTAIMLKERRSGRSVAVHYYRAGCAGSALDPLDVAVDAIADARLLHVTGITLALGDAPRRAVRHAMHVAREAGVIVSLDANFRYKLGTASQLVGQFEEVVDLADHVLLSWGDAATCAGSEDAALVHAYVKGLGRPVTVLKGPRGGATAFEDGVATAEVDVVTAEVVDPVGAGDGFAVGYLHGVLEGHDRHTCLTHGAWVAAQVVGHTGDYEGLPTRAELEVATTPAPLSAPVVSR
ncbi:sugar kinase [Nitriliruptoraceae bacterium ZYF776]|nr:sugar kinase [Profundirhabdus halotolerans]